MRTLLIDAHELPAVNLQAESGLLMVMPYIDEAAAHRATGQISQRAQAEGLILAIRDSEQRGFIHIANQAFRQSRSSLFGYIAQDAFAGRGWGQRVLAAFAQNPARGLLALNDGKWNGLLAAFGVVRRSWAEHNYAGDLFMPGYFGHYADVELTLLALQAGVHAYDPNCVMMEVDYEKDGKPVHAPDQHLFKTRRATGFDGRVHAEKLLKLFE